MADLKVTSTVDTGPITAGMDQSAEAVRGALSDIKTQFTEASTVVSRATRQISEDTKTAATSVSAEWTRAAAASVNYAKAQQEVRAASVVARSATEEDVASIAVLAAAKQKAAVAAAEQAAATKAVAEAQTQEATEVQLSTNVIVAAFQRMWIAVREATAGMATSLTEVQGAMVGTAEKAQVSAEGIGGAFAGLSGLLGGALLVGFAAHFADELEQMQVKLGLLSEKTGISIQMLAGLKQMAKETGQDFDGLETALTKMQKAQMKAVSGGEEQRKAFEHLGISLAELETLNPEELLGRIAEGMKNAATSAERNAAAVTLFGKGGAAAIPILREFGGEITNVANATGKQTGITEASVQQAREWNRLTADLSNTFRAIMIPVMQALIPVLKGVWSVFEVGATIVIEVGNLVGGFFELLLRSVVGLARIVNDAMTGNFGAIAGDAVALKDSLGGTWTSVKTEAVDAFQAMMGELKHTWASGKAAIAADSKIDLSDLEGGKKTDTRLQQWRAELDKMEEAEDGFHEINKAQEAAFWNEKLTLVKAGTKLYAEVYHLMREAERASDREALKDEEQAVAQRVAATKAGSSERVTVLLEELAHLKAIGLEETDYAKRLEVQLTEATKANLAERAKEIQSTAELQVLTAKKASDERVEIERRALAQMIALGMQETDAYRAGLRRAVELQREADADREKSVKISAEARETAELGTLEATRRNIEFSRQMGDISAAEELEQLRELETEKAMIQFRGIMRRIQQAQADPTTSPSEQTALIAKLQALETAHQAALVAIDQRGALQRQTVYHRFFDTIAQGFQATIQGMQQGTLTFSQGMQRVWANIALQFEGSLVQMLTKWLAHEAAKVMAHIAGNTAIVASDTAAAGASDSINLMKTIKSIGRAAAHAAAWAFSHVMEAVPFPVNVVLAPLAAAGAFVGVLAFGALASAREGLFSQEEQLAMVHRHETVLPAAFSLGFQNLFAGGLSPALAGGGAGPAVNNSTSNSTSLNLQYSPTFHGGSGDAAMDPDRLANMIRGLHRNGKLNLR